MDNIVKFKFLVFCCFVFNDMERVYIWLLTVIIVVKVSLLLITKSRMRHAIDHVLVCIMTFSQLLVLRTADREDESRWRKDTKILGDIRPVAESFPEIAADLAVDVT
jgi:hypothetical protein